jgi:hypothetical protein
MPKRLSDDVFSLTCLNNIGFTDKYLEQYDAGLQTLNEGLQKAEQINQQIDQAIKEKLTP